MRFVVHFKSRYTARVLVPIDPRFTVWSPWQTGCPGPWRPLLVHENSSTLDPWLSPWSPQTLSPLREVLKYLKLYVRLEVLDHLNHRAISTTRYTTALIFKFKERSFRPQPQGPLPASPCHLPYGYLLARLPPNPINPISLLARINTHQLNLRKLSSLSPHDFSYSTFLYFFLNEEESETSFWRDERTTSWRISPSFGSRFYP